MTAGPDETFVLTKNDYEESTKNILKSLFSDSEFTDVSLASSDHKQLRGHKAILGAASSFFRSIFKQNPAANLVLYLKGVTAKDLGSIMEFVYLGQTSISKADLPAFMEAAEELKIEGLMQPRKPEPENMSFLSTAPHVIIDENVKTENVVEMFPGNPGSLQHSDLSFPDNADMGSSMVTQTQDQPQYMFGQFSPTFDTQGGLKKPAIRHRKQKTKRPNFEGGETGDGAKSETDQEIHYCQNCQFHTAHKQSLRRHMMQIHGIEFRTIPNESKRHPCFACEFRSDHITSLKRHIEKMHPDKQIPDPLY